MKNFISSLKYPKPNKDLDLGDAVILLVLMFFSFITRDFRVQYPAARIFDEIYFGNFSNYYLNREYFFDIHPPLGKLTFAFFAWLSKDPATTNYFSAIEKYLEKDYITLRQTAASVSSLVCPFAFLGLRFFGFSRLCSVFGAFYLAIESMLIVEGRLILTDGILHASVMFCIFSLSYSTIFPDSTVALILLGVSTGCAISVKYTGMSVLVVIGIHQILEATGGNLYTLFRSSDKDSLGSNEIISFSKFQYMKKKLHYAFYYIKSTPLHIVTYRMIVICFVAFGFMFIMFAFHIIILSNNGPGNGMMDSEFLRTIMSKSTADRSNRTQLISLPYRVLKLINRMHSANMGITQKHSAQSNWYDWPFLRTKSIPYYTNHHMSLVLHPNPFVWISAVIGAFLSLFLSMLAFFYSNYDLLHISIFPAAYFSSWLPFALIPRSIFIYHYLVPLMMGVLCFATFIDVVFQHYKTFRACFFFISIVCAFISWIFFSPWSYAMVGYDWGIRQWYRNMW